MHYANYNGSAGLADQGLAAPRCGQVSAQPRRRWHVSPEGFRELRLSCFLSQRAAADFLGVSVATVRRWDRGQRRVPWAVVRLLRLKRLGDLGALAPAWDGWRLDGDALWSPEGFAYRVGEVGWWGLLVAQARAFRERYDRGV